MAKTTRTVTVAGTVDTSGANAAGDVLSSIIGLAGLLDSRGGGRITSVVVIDKDKQNAAMDVVFFSAAVTVQAANAAFNPSAADVAAAMGHVAILAGDYSTFSANSIATKANVNLSVQPGTADVYAVLVSRGTPTYTNAANLILKVTAEWDG